MAAGQSESPGLTVEIGAFALGTREGATLRAVVRGNTMRANVERANVACGHHSAAPRDLSANEHRAGDLVVKAALV